MEDIILYPGEEKGDSHPTMRETKFEEIRISGGIQTGIGVANSTGSFYDTMETEVMNEEYDLIKRDLYSHVEGFHAVIESMKHKETMVQAEEIATVCIAPPVLPEIRKKSRPEESLQDEKSYPPLCRLCAIPSGDMIYIFGSTILHQRIVEKIQRCLPITVKKNDTLSKKVCSSCLQKLESCYQFHMTVMEAEKQLLVFREQKSGSLTGKTRDSNCEIQNIEPFMETLNSGRTSALEIRQDGCEAALNSPIGEVPRLKTRIVPSQKYSYCLRDRKSIKYNSDSDDGLSRDKSIDGHAPAAQKVGRQLIECHICKTTLQTIGNCHTHARSHASTNYYPCCFCNKISKTEPEWKEHWLQHDGIAYSPKFETNALLYSCNECGKKFATKITLQNHKLHHLRRVKNERQRKPGDEVSNSETSLQQHIIGVPDKCETSSASISGTQFRNEKELNADEVKHMFPCICCKKKLSSIVSLERHKNNCFDNRKKYVCDYCEEVFRVKRTLRRHMRIHIKKLRLSCDICSKSFKHKQNRDKHRRIHTGERPFSCHICSKSFTTKYVRDKHRRTHTGERPYSCDICSKSFGTKYIRDNHQRIHTGERPYSCDICLKSFTFKQARDTHRKIHIGE